MFKDILIGQYISADSPIHKMDARVKIILTMAFIILLFSISGFLPYIIVTGFILVTVFLCKIPLRLFLKGIKPMAFILLFTVILNLFMTDGTPAITVPVADLFTIKITYEGIYSAVFLFLRLLFLIMGTSVLTLTTSPLSLTDGIESLLRPLKKIKVPAHEIAMMMTIAIRFIPTLAEETDKIMKAQMARGADFESGNLLKRAKAMVPLLVPLFVSSFRRADELATAMEARCYHGGEGRTKMKQMKITKIDIKASIIFILVFAASICISIFILQ